MALSLPQEPRFYSYLLFYLYVGKSLFTLGLEIKHITLEDASVVLKKYGTIDCNIELMNLSWRKLEHVFSVRQQEDQQAFNAENTSNQIQYEPHWIGDQNLNTKSVDLLIVDKGYIEKPLTAFAKTKLKNLVAQTNKSSRPKIVVEIWGESAHLWKSGPTSSLLVKQWNELG